MFTKPAIKRWDYFVVPYFPHESVWDTTVRFLGLSVGEEISFEAFCSPLGENVCGEGVNQMTGINDLYQAWRKESA